MLNRQKKNRLKWACRSAQNLAEYMASSPAVPARQQTRLRSDSNPANSSDGESTSELLEIDTPPLVLISSRVKSSGALSTCVNTGVVVVRYTYDSTTPAKLLQLVASKMKGRHALSIAFLMHGNSCSLKVCSQKVSMVAVGCIMYARPPTMGH